jgi:mono/diheme cytochrome c family protein
MKAFIAGAICSIAACMAALSAYLGLGLMEVRADIDPPQWEADLMTSFLHASVRRQAPAVQNPLPDSEATLIAGGKLYMNDCVGCHGAPGQAPSEFGASFFPRVPQFAHVGTQYSQAELFWMAKHGIRFSGMFPKAYYADTDLWNLVAFISRIRALPPAVTAAINQPAPN